MAIMQFGNFYFDPKDIIAIDTVPFSTIGEMKYHLYLKTLSIPLCVEGEAAGKCLAAFIDENRTIVKK